MTIARCRQAVMPAMRARDLQIRIRRPVIVPNVMLMQVLAGWVQPMTIHRLQHHAHYVMRSTDL